MGVKDKAEACGRCTMTTVMDVTDDIGTNPFDGDRIELPEDELRAVSRHVVAVGRLKDRLDRWATSITYDR